MTTARSSTQVIRTAGHQYLLGDRELLGVTRILETAGVTDYSAPWFTEWHRNRGRLVHQLIALENAGVLDDDVVDDHLIGFLIGYRLFREQVGGEVEFYEQIVADPEIGAAGTLDLIVRHPDDHSFRRRLYDVKPGAARATAIQTAAYARFARSLYDGTILFDRAGLILPGDGTYAIDPFNKPEHRNDEQVFLSAVRIAHWRRAA